MKQVPWIALFGFLLAVVALAGPAPETFHCIEVSLHDSVDHPESQFEDRMCWQYAGFGADKMEEFRERCDQQQTYEEGSWGSGPCPGSDLIGVCCSTVMDLGGGTALIHFYLDWNLEAAAGVCHTLLGRFAPVGQSTEEPCVGAAQPIPGSSAAASSAAADGLTVVSSVWIGEQGEPSSATQYITADKLRTSDGVRDTIFDLPSGRIVFVDHMKKEFWETTPAELQFADDHLLHGRPQIDPLMAGMVGPETEVEVRKGSEPREILGYVCDRYSLSIGKLRFELWAARGLKAPEQYYDASKLIYATTGPMASLFDKLFEEMKKIDGFPLRTELDARLPGMTLRTVNEAVEVLRAPIPLATFGPPPGYSKAKPAFGEGKSP